MAAIMHFSSLEGVLRGGDKAVHQLCHSAGTPLVLRVKRLFSEVKIHLPSLRSESHSCIMILKNNLM